MALTVLTRSVVQKFRSCIDKTNACLPRCNHVSPLARVPVVLISCLAGSLLLQMEDEFNISSTPEEVVDELSMSPEKVNEALEQEKVADASNEVDHYDHQVSR